MIEKVDLVFNYGGKWVLKPEVMYLKKLKHMMQDFDADLLSYIDICAEYTEKLGFSKVSELQLYAIDEGELPVSTPNIIDQNERHNIAVDVETNCDSSDEEKNVGFNSSDNDSKELELFRKERTQDVNEKFDKFLHLEKGMSFKDLFEAKRVVGFYAIANKVNEKITNMGEGSSQKVQDVTLTTAHESQTFEQEQQFDQHSTIGDDE
ncbi:hypothetical protein KY284_030791 [Solanum tuberosum]|nr:hypothetical protein KY284_030791 [Solanum tuberosum]